MIISKLLHITLAVASIYVIPTDIKTQSIIYTMESCHLLHNVILSTRHSIQLGGTASVRQSKIRS